jgi:hypothetical protein
MLLLQEEGAEYPEHEAGDGAACDQRVPAVEGDRLFDEIEIGRERVLDQLIGTKRFGDHAG